MSSDLSEPVSLGNLTATDSRYQVDADKVIRSVRGCPFHDDSITGDLLVVGYEAARAVLTDRGTSRDRRREHGGVSSTVDTSLMRIDGADHLRLRKPMLATLTARTKRFRSVVRFHVATQLERLVDGVPFDAVSQFSQPLAAEIVASLLGVNKAQRPDLLRWLVDMALIFELQQDADQSDRFETTFAQFSAFLEGAAASRRTKPGDDWITDLVQQSDMTDVEIMINLRITMVAAVLPLSAMISNTLLLLVSNPAELAKLRADRSLSEAMLEEALRVEPPVEMTGRGAHLGITAVGYAIAPYREIEVVIRGANHDPDAFENPDAFSIDAERKPHLSFGAGFRTCVGSAFCRQAAEMAVMALLDRFAVLELRDPASAPAWRTTPVLRTLDELSLVGRA